MLRRGAFTGMGRDFVAIEALELECIVGLHSHERDRMQPLVVDVRLGLDLALAGRSGRIADTCDYSVLAQEITALLQHRRYKLLENATEEMAAMIFGVHGQVADLTLRVAKLRAVPGAKAAVIHIERTRMDFPRRSEPARFGEVEVLLETREAGLYLLHVEAGQQIPLHHHRVMRELEWLVSGELYQDGQPVTPRSARSWEHGVRHDYENRSTERATLFCCDSPPFIRDDEIEERGSLP